MRRLLVYVAAFFYVGAGAMHFLRPAPYLKIMPAYVPWHLAMVYISGAAEIAGGVGLFIPMLRQAAAWGLVALLIAVFPANVNMAVHDIQVTLTPVSAALLWARLPLQGLLIWWLLWCTSSPKQVYDYGSQGSRQEGIDAHREPTSDGRPLRERLWWQKP